MVMSLDVVCWQRSFSRGAHYTEPLDISCTTSLQKFRVGMQATLTTA